MTALTRNPSNPNLIHPNKFELNFARLPNMQYFCQTVTVPGVSLSEIPKPTPFVDMYIPGEKTIYDLLNVTFMVDEELQAWKEVHDWIRAMTFPKDYSEYQNLANLNRYTTLGKTTGPQYSDATITILSSSNIPLYRFKFYEVFPTSISSFAMSSTDTPDNIITADATFRFTYYDIDKL